MTSELKEIRHWCVLWSWNSLCYRSDPSLNPPSPWKESRVTHQWKQKWRGCYTVHREKGYQHRAKVLTFSIKNIVSVKLKVLYNFGWNIWVININLIFLPEAIIKICLQDIHSYKPGIPLKPWNLKSGRNHTTNMLPIDP